MDWHYVVTKLLFGPQNHMTIFTRPPVSYITEVTEDTVMAEWNDKM